MKVTRQKQSKRILSFYKNNFALRVPYQVVCDGTICHAALRTKVHIKEHLETYFDGTVRLFTTPCCVDEIKKLGENFSGSVMVSKRMEFRKCRHNPPLKASACLESLVVEDNKNHLIIATQDKVLREKLRKVPGLPLLYINFNCFLIEPVSEASKTRALKRAKELVSPIEVSVKRKSTEESEEETEELPKKKRKGPKGPNPLSVKKKKTKPAVAIVSKLKTASIASDASGSIEIVQSVKKSRHRKRSHSSRKTSVIEVGTTDISST